MELKAKYFDGTLREGQDAVIDLLSESIKIQPNEEGFKLPIYWQVAQVQQLHHHRPNHVMLQHTVNTKHYLELAKDDFNNEVVPYYRNAAFTQPLEHTKSSALKYVLALSVTVLVVLASVYFFVVPWVSERFAKVVPKDTEVQIGETMFKSTIAEYTVNDSATKIINEFFKQIKRPQDYDIKITVVNNPQVNAFAMPGGNIVVFDGIIKKMDGYPQLAALLGHEFSHVQYRHTTRSVFRSLGGYLFIAALVGDANGVVSIIADNANSLQNLGYSRGLEHEADEEGFKLMVDNQIDPNGMLQLFEKLEEETNGADIPEFLSSHPVTQSRKDFAKEEISKGGYTVAENAKMKAFFEQLKKVVGK
jgi:beta-barrel assembly-enhancing protease